MGFRKQILPGRHGTVLIQALACLTVVGCFLRSEAGLISLVGPTLGRLIGTPPMVDVEPMFQAPPDWFVTGGELDVAIEGSGYFVVRDPETPRQPPRLTRSGSFRIDSDGRLISIYGLRLQGVSPDGTSVIDLAIPASQSIHGATLKSLKIAPDGTFTALYFDDTSRNAGRIALWQPAPDTRLCRWSDDDYTDPDMPDDWRLRLVTPDGITRRLHPGFVQSPEPEIRVVGFHKHRLLDTPSFPMRVGLEFCVTFDGPGFLVVRDPKTGTRFLTRCGLLHQDWEGWLVTVPDGYRVQGWTNRAFTLSGDIRVDAAERPEESADAILAHASAQPDGSIAVTLSDGVRFTRARFAIAQVPDLTRLEEIRHGLYVMPGSENLRLTNEASTDLSTRFEVGYLDPRFLSAERQQWIHEHYRFRQKAVERTGVGSHLAIAGDGFFRMRDPDTGRQILTRSGLFHWSEDGYLEGLHGWRVQGRSLTEPSESLIDVRTHHGKRPTSSDRYEISFQGEIGYSLPDGGQQTLAGIVLVHVPDPMILRECEPRHYLLPDGDIDLSRCFDGSPDDRRLGKVMSGALEAIWYEEYFEVKNIPDTGRLLQLRGLAGRLAKIQVSADMNAWSDWMTMDEYGRLQGGWMDVRDPTNRAVPLTDMVLDAEKPEEGARFYRLLVETRSQPWM
ncbi:MAG: hypothetical protein JNK85_05545 [Verrucomicrobiales bacterium]|nr:hypothetical protein [Verrucomicrobiales bacterium]